MRIFEAWTHVGGGGGEFVGNSWRDGGYTVAADGAPDTDSRGNRVSSWSIRAPTDADADLLYQAYGGDEECLTEDDHKRISDWLMGEFGFSPADAERMAQDWIDA